MYKSVVMLATLLRRSCACTTGRTREILQLVDLVREINKSTIVGTGCIQPCDIEFLESRRYLGLPSRPSLIRLNVQRDLIINCCRYTICVSPRWRQKPGTGVCFSIERHSRPDDLTHEPRWTSKRHFRGYP